MRRPSIFLVLGITLLTACSSTSAQARANTQTGSTRAQASAEVPKVLSRTPTQPAWHEVTEPPAVALRSPVLSTGGGAKSVQASKFWIAVGSVEDTVRWVNGHPPKGYTVGLSGGGFSQPGKPTVHSVMFHSITPGPEDASVDLIVNLVALDGGEVGIRADAEINWSHQHL